MSQMTPAVNFLDPVTPSAAMAVRDTANNLNQAAQLQAQMVMAKAHLDTQKVIAKAQIDATASEHAKYQDFLKERDAAAAQVGAKEEQTRFEHQQELNRQANEFLTKQHERVRSLEIDKQRAHLAALTARADAAEKLAASRAKSADDVTEAEAQIAAASTVYGKDRDELISMVGGTLSDGRTVPGSLHDLVAQQISGLNASEMYAMTSADEAVRGALDKLTIGPEMEENLAEAMVDSAKKHPILSPASWAFASGAAGPLSREQAMRGLAAAKAQGIVGALGSEAAAQLADKLNAKGGNVAPDKVKQMIGLAVAIKTGAAGKRGDEPDVQAQLQAYKKLHDEVTQGDPLKGTEVAFALRGLDRAVQSLSAEQVRELMRKKAGDEKGATEGQVTAMLNALGMLKGVGEVPGAAGVTLTTTEGLALTADKLARYVGGEQHALEVLPPELQSLAADFYKRRGGEAGTMAYGRMKLSEGKLKEATAKRGRLETSRGLLDQQMAAEAMREEANLTSGLLESLKEE